MNQVGVLKIKATLVKKLGENKVMATKIDQKIVAYKVLTEEDKVPVPEIPKEFKRPEKLMGETWKLRNAAERYNLYMTINFYDGKVFEVFFDSSHTESAQWVKALSRMISALLRSPDENLNLEFVAKQLMMIHSDQGYHTGGPGGFVPGIVHHIGKVLRSIKAPTDTGPSTEEVTVAITDDGEEVSKEEIEAKGKQCPECHEFTLVTEGGCTRCTNTENCDYLGDCG